MKIIRALAFLFSFLFLLTKMTLAQEKIDIDHVKVKNDSSTQIFLYQLITKKGNKLIGEVLQVRSDSLTFSNADLGIIKFPVSGIESLTIYDPEYGEEGKRYMVGSNHYLIAPSTPYGLQKGEINIQNSQLFLLSSWFGISDNFSIGGGFSILPGIEFKDQLFYLIPKFNFALAPKVNVSVQYAQIFLSDTDNTSLLSFSTSYGSRDQHVSIGYTTPLFADGDDVAFDAGLINLGAVLRAGNKFAVIGDVNIPTVATDFGIYGIGGRYIGKSSSFDFGFITNSEIEGIPLPWFNYTLRIK